MITCINQGPNGPSFSQLIATAHGCNVTFYVTSGRSESSDSVILDKKNVAILAKKLLAWSGENPEPAPVVTGDL